MSKRRPSRIYRWLPLALLAALSACRPAEMTPEPEVARPIKLLRIARGAEERPFEYSGRVAPARQADMAFEISGRLIAFPVSEGQQVEEGHVLAQLDVRDVQAALDAEVARQRAARAEFDRIGSLFDQGIASRRELDQVTSQLDVANAAVRTARKRVEDAVLRAPFAGRVARKLVEDFANVQAKQVVVMLQDDSWLEVKVDIPESDLRFADGSKTPEERAAQLKPVVEISSFPGRRFEGRITEMTTTADPATRTFSVTVAFTPPTDIMVLPGMTARVLAHLRQSGDDSVVVPVRAVFAGSDGRPRVWRLDAATMRVRAAPVALGAMSDEHVAILAGLADGDEIAVSGVARLREGMLVRRFSIPGTR